jgi:hypothetical protein
MTYYYVFLLAVSVNAFAFSSMVSNIIINIIISLLLPETTTKSEPIGVGSFVRFAFPNLVAACERRRFSNQCDGAFSQISSDRE